MREEGGRVYWLEYGFKNLSVKDTNRLNQRFDYMYFIMRNQVGELTDLRVVY